MAKDFEDNHNEIDEFLSQFDDITDNLNKSDNEEPAQIDDETKVMSKTQVINEFLDSEEPARKTRSERLAEEKEQKANSKGARTVSAIGGFFAGLGEKIGSKFKDKFTDEEQPIASDSDDMTRKAKKKKYRLNKWKLLRAFILFCIVCALILTIYLAGVIMKTPKIDPDNIYSMLSESSILYDDAGNIIATVSSGETRTNIEYSELPPNLVNAFVAIEDKTFWEHHGFNIIRMFGAMKDALFNGGHVSGTSTITQQLARNVYLSDIKSERSISRKISEAYYSIELEKDLSKELIVEAYLNTISLGFESYGVQMAAQSYFSKDVEDLDLIECAALAALPKAPSSYALIKRLLPEDVDPETMTIIHEGEEYVYVYNGDVSKDRRDRVLKNMVEQGYITQEECDAALAEDLATHMNPNLHSLSTISSYFQDYVIQEVIQDFMDNNGLEYDEAKDKVYNGGLQIYTSMNSNYQQIVEETFANNANFPGVVHVAKDGNGNALNTNGKIMLYKYGNIIAEDGNFYLWPGEFEWMGDGSLKLFSGKRLNFYKTSVGGQTDISIEFKPMYRQADNTFYSIQGGTILIPQQYKQRDDDGNAIISKDFFENPDHAGWIQKLDDGKLLIPQSVFTVKQEVVQPQAAMVITDYHNGQIKAMVGGRNITGRMLFNRAINPHQPGSSIKPIAVYGAALQESYELAQGGTTKFFNYQPNNYENYFTAATAIDDAPMTAGGKTWPKNWYSGFRGIYTLREAVQQSVNVCAVKVWNEVGPEFSSKFAEGLGLTTIVKTGDVNDLNPAALALGGMTRGATPLEMASAYGTYPNGGLYVEPIAYTRIENKQGDIIFENIPKTRQACDPGVAFIMTDILKSVVTNGLGKTAAISGQSVGGKTGTTTDNFDAWFVGFTAQYSAAMWIGNDVNLELSQGSASAARVWQKVMSQVTRGLGGSYPSAPSNVVSATIDTKSGRLATDLSAADPRGTVRSEYFLKGTVPTQTDNVHTYVTICPESGYLATPDCPTTATFFGVMRPYLPSGVGDIGYEVPHYYCDLHNSNPGAYPIAGSGGGVTDIGAVTVDPNLDPEITDPPVDENGNPIVDPVDPGTEPGTEPIGPTPVDPTPVDPTPVDPTPVDPTPVTPPEEQAQPDWV